MKITDEMVEAAWGTLCKHVDPEGWPTDAEVRFALKAALAAAPACPHIRSSGPPKRATNWCALAAPPQDAPDKLREALALLAEARDFIDTTRVPAYPAGADLADRIDALRAALVGEHAARDGVGTPT